MKSTKNIKVHENLKKKLDKGLPVFLVMGILLIIIAVVKGYYDYKFITRATVIDAVVVKTLNANTTPVFEYIRSGTQKKYFTSNISSTSPRYRVGDKSKLMIDQDSNRISELNLLDTWGLTVLLAAIGIALIVANFCCRFASSRKHVKGNSKHLLLDRKIERHVIFAIFIIGGILITCVFSYSLYNTIQFIKQSNTVEAIIIGFHDNDEGSPAPIFIYTDLDSTVRDYYSNCYSSLPRYKVGDKVNLFVKDNCIRVVEDDWYVIWGTDLMLIIIGVFMIVSAAINYNRSK